MGLGAALPDGHLGRTRASATRIGRRWHVAAGPARPVVLVIDAQNYMVGERGADDRETYLSNCGDIGWQALDHARALIEAARGADVPVIYTRFALDLDRGEGGGFTRKRSPP